jgi:hypothetical protein
MSGTLDAEFLDELEQQLFRGEPEPSLGAHVSVKLARAKALLQRLRGPRQSSRPGPQKIAGL